jgi:hypothetical protein
MLATSFASSSGLRKSLSMQREPTRSVVVTTAAAVAAGIGERAKLKWGREELGGESEWTCHGRHSLPRRLMSKRQIPR